MAKRGGASELLGEALDDGRLLEYHRGVLGAGVEHGFVVGIGKKWVLFQQLDDSFGRLDGYSAVRRRDIVRTRPEWKTFPIRALALSGEVRSVPVGIDLDRTRDLLRTATAGHRIVTIHTEYSAPDVCYIGAFRPDDEKWFTLKEISTNAKWRSKRTSWRYNEITRVDFDGGYERALLAVVDTRKKRSRSGGGDGRVQDRRVVTA